MYRANTNAHNRLRIVRALTYIESNLDQRIALKDLAEVACLSRFQFSRKFGELVGYSPMALIRRLHLIRAAELLRSGKTSIAAAADFAGYSGTTAFARACAKVLGCAPGALQREGRGSEPNYSKIDVVDLAERRAAGFSFAGPYDEVCKEFAPLARSTLANGNWRPELGAFALIHEGEPVSPSIDRWFEANIAVPIDPSTQKPDGYDSITMPAGRYAFLLQRHDDNRAQRQYHELIDRRLAVAGHTRRAGPVIRWHRYDPALRPRAMQLWSILVPIA